MSAGTHSVTTGAFCYDQFCYHICTMLDNITIETNMFLNDKHLHS